MIFNSTEYWDNRYRSGDNSGIGSQGILSHYKADFLNDFVKTHNIQNVCELGCGDSQFLLYQFPYFIGYDVSQYIIAENKKKYNNLFTSSIDELGEYDLLLSLDVIYHLIDDTIYLDHIKQLFKRSKKYVIIYSPNRNEIFSASHNMYRYFTNDIPDDFILEYHVNNPYKGELTQSDFYVYKKISIDD
jgi:hypothetical protein